MERIESVAERMGLAEAALEPYGRHKGLPRVPRAEHIDLRDGEIVGVE